MAITVYQSPHVCSATPPYKALDKAGVAYEVIDISQDSDARDYVMALGYLRGAGRRGGDEHWSGFRPDRIKALAVSTATA